MDRKRWLYLEIAGTLFTYIAGHVLQQCYALSGGAAWAILFACVNQSTWEHVKLFSMPYILWGFIELAALRLPLRRFVVAKVTGLFLLSGSIILFFSVYSGMVGASYFILDVLSVFACVGVAHLLSYKLVLSRANVDWLFPIAVSVLVLFLSMYITFTVKPPHFRLFEDPDTRIYGITNVPREYSAQAYETK